MNQLETAFCLGYGSGLELSKSQGTHWSPKDVLKHFPFFNHAEIDRFLEGQTDGIKGDTYRYDLLMKKHPMPGAPAEDECDCHDCAAKKIV